MKHDLAVVIGRFQPFHTVHKDLLEFAASKAEKVLVLIGSAYIARDSKNPFTHGEREAMIRASRQLPHDRLGIEPLMDQTYNDQLWVASIQEIVNQYAQHNVAIIGHHKDHSSYYLDMFPGWSVEEFPSQKVKEDGTFIRNMYFTTGNVVGCPDITTQFMDNFKKREEYAYLKTGHEFIAKYRKQFEGLKYPPFFNTADSVVICNGHILLVKRRSHPGKGLWALPGGFINVNERIKDAIIRELYEETNIDVSRQLLTASLRSTHVFDDPGRSLRGRIITHAGLFILPQKNLPKIKGSDDAEKAKWFPLSDFYGMTEQLFEDHHSIGQYMINRAG